jgi:single-stranded-DNA-specific exonuclease
MPSGPDGFVAHPRYTAEFSKARGLLLAHPGRWRVVYHYDADGIASASSLLRAFARLGYPAQATPLLHVERDRITDLLHRTAQPMVVVDTGASWLDLFSKHSHPVIVLDHHRYPGVPDPPPLPDHFAFVNPLDWQVDGMVELCGATLSWLFTIFLDAVNWDNAPWGLSGAIGDRQHVGGFRGLNATLVEEAVRRSVIVRRGGLPLFGPTLGEAIASSIDPFLRGLSGHPEAATSWLSGLGLDAGRSPGSLTPEEVGRLRAAMKAQLERSKVLPEFVRALDTERWFLPALGWDAEELSNLQSAAGREGIPGVGVAIALGDPAAVARSRAAETAWRTGILRGMLRIEAGEIRTMSGVRWFESPDTPLAGTQAGLSVAYLLPPDRPVLVFSDGGTAPTKVSGRGLLRQVERGLDLSTALRDAAAAVGGEGGGHRVASGATIPPGSRDRFLEVANREIARQLHLDGASP